MLDSVMENFKKYVWNNLGMWIIPFTFTTINFYEIEKQIKFSNENLAFKWRCAVNVKYTPDFEDQAWERECSKSL